MSKEYVNPTLLFDSMEYGFSQIVTSTSKRTIYLSGQTPFNAEGEVVGANRKEQMQQCLTNVRMALEAVGGSLKDIVALRIYMVNYDPDTEGDVIAEGLKEFFPGNHPPATTWIGISSLAVKDFLIEIEATAALE
ncbi:RidA family protein [Leptolyngbya sp. NK1-12]|uniref:RidA family protein n=1 Tax=Leptolyngbya sp. NK1-12 TaxID=2547451 RepID=A0AA96WBQ6_9CYAN|nr:RidA family protein [Leptolyngbya sp. NK1-12]WNZ22159.1 RidA family protein [Leptolyngbya sp. NK1-12]